MVDETRSTGSVNERPVDFHYRIVDQQVTVEETVQRLGINRLSIGVDLRGDVTGTGLLGRHLHRVIWLGGVLRSSG